VYVLHFKANRKMLKEYPSLTGYTRELYQMDAIRRTVDFEHIKNHYFRSHPTINPHRVVPNGPDLSYLEEPHGRGSL
jgi:glutathionyl-hydroquinone reductase